MKHYRTRCNVWLENLISWNESANFLIESYKKNFHSLFLHSSYTILFDLLYLIYIYLITFEKLLIGFNNFYD